MMANIFLTAFTGNNRSARGHILLTGGRYGSMCIINRIAEAVRATGSTLPAIALKEALFFLFLQSGGRIDA
jgi:hypothetical protein